MLEFEPASPAFGLLPFSLEFLFICRPLNELENGPVAGTSIPAFSKHLPLLGPLFTEPLCAESFASGAVSLSTTGTRVLHLEAPFHSKSAPAYSLGFLLFFFSAVWRPIGP